MHVSIAQLLIALDLRLLAAYGRNFRNRRAKNNVVASARAEQARIYTFLHALN